jgi:hypothetical protein
MRGVGDRPGSPGAGYRVEGDQEHLGDHGTAHQPVLDRRRSELWVTRRNGLSGVTRPSVSEHGPTGSPDSSAGGVPAISPNRDRTFQAIGSGAYATLLPTTATRPGGSSSCPNDAETDASTP